MATRDTTYVLRKVFGHQNKLRQRITLGCNGMLITGWISSFENYIAASALQSKESSDVNNVIIAIEVLSSLQEEEELPEEDNIIYPAGMTLEQCDDLIVLQDATIQLPNGTISPIFRYWFGRISAVDFWLDSNKIERSIPFNQDTY